MKKVSNVFNKGLTMDVSPLSTTGDSLSDCLNGTFCTMNGDELVLQNDMGNGRVQTAYLPEGYIPVGTTQLGGIVYVASYNPFTNKCQIGSFPSPQRTSDKRDIISKEIPLDKDENIVRIVLSDQIFKPGDKFYLTIPSKYMQYKYSEDFNTIDAVKNHFLKFSVAIISEESQIIKLNEDPIIEENTTTKDDFTKDINKFIVCTSKISGKLILIIERVVFDYSINFNAFRGLTTIDNEVKNTFYLNFNLNANSQDKFFPYKLELNSLAEYAGNSYEQKSIFPVEDNLSNTGFTSGNSSDFRSFEYSAKNIYNNNIENPIKVIDKLGSIEDLISELTSNGYWDKVNQPVYLNISATLYTNNFKINQDSEKVGGQLPISTKMFTIDLSKVASNTVELSMYKYTVLNKNNSIEATINFSLQAYLNLGQSIKDIKVLIYEVKDNEVSQVDFKDLGANIQPVIFENLTNNYLYLVEFQIKTGTDNSQDEKIITIYRYLYSNPNIVNSFDNSLNDYEYATPKLTLQYKIKDGFKLIPDTYSDYSIKYPKGLASTNEHEHEFTGTETQIWKLAETVPITIIENNDIPIEITSIKADGKDYQKDTSNAFMIDTGLQNQEKTFTYIYNTSNAINKICNILERVSDYLYISENDLDCTKCQYPARDTYSSPTYNSFYVRGNGIFTADNFYKVYSGNPDDSSIYDKYDEKCYGWTNLTTQYRWTFVKFVVIDNDSYIQEYLPPNITKAGKESNFYLLAPGGNGMLFTLKSEMSFEDLYSSIKKIFDTLYTYRKERSINIYYASDIQEIHKPDQINIDKTIKVSGINMDLLTNTNEFFTQLVESYDKYYSKKNYRKPTIRNLQINLRESKRIEESNLLKNYPINIDSQNDILVKSNNILYKATHPNLVDNKIYFVKPSVNNVAISDSALYEELQEITYRDIQERFEARHGRLYVKSGGFSYNLHLGVSNSGPRIYLPIKIRMQDTSIK